MLIDRLKELMEQGLSFEEIRTRIEEYKRNTQLLFSLERVENLAKNGRLPMAVAKLANLLNIRFIGKPTPQGTIKPIQYVRGPRKNISKIVCSGDVVYLKRANPDDPNGQDQIAMSEQADYDVQKEIIVMTGKPVMMQGSNKLHGDRIEILVSEGNRMRVINPVVYYTGQSLLTKPAEGSTRP